jgi:adenylate cyclase
MKKPKKIRTTERGTRRPRHAGRSERRARRKEERPWLAPLIDDLDRWLARPGERRSIEEEIWEKWGAGFSHLTRERGILHFLGLIRRSHTMSLPAVEKHGGTIIKIVADDIIAVFDSPKHAIDAAVDMQKRIREYNGAAEEDFRIGMCIGIESGRILLIGDEDLYGDPVNIASKLGEDLAGRGCILVGPEAYAEYCRQFPGRKSLFDAQHTEIAKVDFSYYRLDWENLMRGSKAPPQPSRQRS